MSNSSRWAQKLVTTVVPRFMAALGLFALASVADAQTTTYEFTFVVPVTFESVHPDVRNVRMECVVQKTAGDFSSAGVLGRRYVEQPLVSRGFTGNITVGVPVPRGALGGPADARAWACFYYLIAVRDGRTYQISNATEYETFAGHRVVSATPTPWRVTGTITPPAAK